MDRIRALEFLVKITQTGSFVGAARSCGVPTSTVSRSIQQLESDLGATLLVRNTRSVVLTEIGQLYIDQVGPALAALNQADEMVSDQAGSLSGTLRMTITPAYGEHCVVPVLKSFMTRYPDLTLDVNLSDSVVSFAGNETDIAIRAAATVPDNIVARKLCTTTFGLYAAPDYLKMYGTPKTAADLKHHRCLLFRDPSGPVNWQAHGEDGWSTPTLRSVFVSNIGRHLREEAVAGNGLVLLPDWSADDYVISKELQKVDLAEASLHYTRSLDTGIYLLYNRSKYSLLKVRLLVDHVISELAIT